jgi:hypothetical protein
MAAGFSRATGMVMAAGRVTGNVNDVILIRNCVMINSNISGTFAFTISHHAKEKIFIISDRIGYSCTYC